MNSKTSQKRFLAALDFDHTVIEENSDTYVYNLAPGGIIPDSVQQLYKEENGVWTDYMQAVFKHLHKSGVTSKHIEQCMQEIHLVKGMYELFTFFKDNNFDVIIISDANTVFIDLILEKHGLTSKVDKIFTNPAEYDSSGCLTVQYYHTQDWCDLSGKNLCKGFVLDEYIAQRARDGIVYEKVAFIGDGSNDFCPTLRLRAQDLVFARKDYRLMKRILAQAEDINAKATIWESGIDIQNMLVAECNADNL